jgi:hypothetical protein
LNTGALAFGLKTVAFALSLELVCAVVGEAGVASIAGVVALLDAAVVCALVPFPFAVAVPAAGAPDCRVLLLLNGGIGWMYIDVLTDFLAVPSALGVGS